MSGDDRTPDKIIGQIVYADDKTPQAEQSKVKGSEKRDEGERAFPNRDPAKKKTGEF
jgi:hypothetical protein